MGGPVARIHRLSALAVGRAKPGLYADGAGLYLQATQGTGGHVNRSWLFRYTRLDGNGEHWMGLGPAHTVTLAEARQAAQEARKLRLQGIDPLEHRKAQRASLALEGAKALSFDECASRYIDAHRAGWKTNTHAKEWESSIARFVSPAIGTLPVAGIDVGLVMQVLRPIWGEIPETASRVRGRIESILNWAGVHGYRKGENPARWRGNLDHLLPRPSKVKPTVHHAALPYDQIPAFMVELRKQDGIARLSLEFIILAAVRSGEALGAEWSEFNLVESLWIIPSSRMKGGREHRVPLCDHAVAILRELEKLRINEFVFFGVRRPRLSNMALHNLLQRMGRDNITVHGFRSSFRDWCGEQTSFPREVAEQALAHAIENQTEAAYRRGDALEKRRRLMDAWGEYCCTAPVAGEVTPLRKRG
jgi:integrase